MLRGNWLSKTCDEIEQKNDVEISDYARNLILMTALAADYDPYPDWIRSKRPDRRDLLGEPLNELIRGELQELAANVRKRGHHKVTYFHVLHWMERSPRLLNWPVRKD